MAGKTPRGTCRPFLWGGCSFVRKLLARPVWIGALLLWAMFALAVTSLSGEGPTFDEQGFLVRGLAYLRGPANGGTRTIIVGHPIGLNALNAALLVNGSTIKGDGVRGESDFEVKSILRAHEGAKGIKKV